MIGINQLTGEVENLEKPLTVTRVQKSTEMNSDKTIKVLGEISKRLIFKSRPVPIMNNQKLKTA